MVSKDEEKYVIWPLYFDESISRKDGRKVSKKLAIEKPNSESILKAAKSLGLNPVLEKEAAHPSRNYKQDGRILIDKKDSKTNVLKDISKKLKSA